MQFVGYDKEKELDTEFQQVYVYPSKALSNPSKDENFDVKTDLDVNLFVPIKSITSRDLIIFLQKQIR